jgi:hypothetical protein
MFHITGATYKYYSMSLYISLTDCIEACLYLSADEHVYVDIGASYTSSENTTWLGVCVKARYNMTSNVCELISNANCSDYNFGSRAVR